VLSLYDEGPTTRKGGCRRKLGVSVRWAPVEHAALDAAQLKQKSARAGEQRRPDVAEARAESAPA